MDTFNLFFLLYLVDYFLSYSFFITFRKIESGYIWCVVIFFLGFMVYFYFYFRLFCNLGILNVLLCVPPAMSVPCGPRRPKYTLCYWRQEGYWIEGAYIIYSASSVRRWLHLPVMQYVWLACDPLISCLSRAAGAILYVFPVFCPFSWQWDEKRKRLSVGRDDCLYEMDMLYTYDCSLLYFKCLKTN